MRRGESLPRFVRFTDEAGDKELVRLGEGSEDCHRLAGALAEICTEDFLRYLLNAKASMDAHGGEILIAADRRKFGSDGEEVKSGESGEWETIGFVANYEHVASTLRDAKREPVNHGVDEVELPEVTQNGDGDEQGDDPPVQEPVDEPEPEEAAA